MSPEKAQEQVLVIPESHFHAVGVFQGFRSYSETYLQALLDPKQFSFRPRGEVETDPAFKQLIPYVVLQFQDQLFHYRRGKAGTETRLQSLRSVGIGGHINPEDGTMSEAYSCGMLRELQEEVDLRSPFRERILGAIYDDRTLVGSVHLGIVHLWQLDAPLASPRESAIAESGFAALEELEEQREQFETWSQFVFAELTRC